MPDPLLLYYQEPDPDRWLPGDRYPRRLIRRLVRGAPQPGGQQRVAINLCAGLDQLGVPYRFNDFRAARRSPDTPVGIIGKGHLLDEHRWRNPILFGASVMSHPLADPTLLERHPNIRRVLVPGAWMRTMCAPYWGDRVHAWPVGIDTDLWAPLPQAAPEFDVLVYDKIRWEHDRYSAELLQPILSHLERAGLKVARIRYGYYREAEFYSLVRRSRSMIFLCEHETQGIAYQQTLACNVPILAWERRGCWQDPEYYPHRVKFEPVSTVPYWDERCGATFAGAASFAAAFDAFWPHVTQGHYSPRTYVLENLTLAHCARLYLQEWADTFSIPLAKLLPPSP